MDWQLGAEPQICTALPGPTDLPSAQELRRKTGTRTLHERGRETLGSMGQKKALQAAGEELPAGPCVALVCPGLVLQRRHHQMCRSVQQGSQTAGGN